jgi:mono/diheme cytochrome c family protein
VHRPGLLARFVGFLAVVVVGLFVMLYYFYELGFPGGLTESRLEAETAAQQVTTVERGYDVYQANCARCHGRDGEGGIGPPLNQQDKLFQHLNPTYLAAILTVGGRFACGDPNSLMPVWSNEGFPPGPLNYRQVEDLIAFIRAENTQTFRVMDPELWEPEIDPATGRSRRSPAGGPGLPVTRRDALPGLLAGRPHRSQPVAGCLGRGLALRLGLRGGQRNVLTCPPSRSPSTSPSWRRRPHEAFIRFANNDAGVQHNVEIRDATGASLFRATSSGVETRTYDVRPWRPARTRSSAQSTPT